MNATQLLAHFDRLAEAPNAVPRLRRFILDLAVRGKLVEQDMADEPAVELLKRICSIVQKSLAPKKSNKQVDAPDAEVAPPFEIPKSWMWTRLFELGRTQTGATPSKNAGEVYGNHMPFVKPGDLLPSHVDYSGEGLSELGLKDSGRFTPAGSLLMVCIGTIGKCQLVDRACSFNQQINSIAPYDALESRYLLAVFMSEFFQRAAWTASAKTTIAILNKGKWEQLSVPLPPLAEQHRIVAKVDELMVLCDQLEAAQQERERRRDRLAAASLQRLNQPVADIPPEAQREHARLHLHHLPRLTTRPEHIKAMRQTIRSVAVRGLLKTESASDESAAILANRIELAKARAATHENLKKDKGLRDGLAKEPPFSIPQNWKWVRLQDIFEISRGGSPRPAGDPMYFGGTVPWITVGEVTKDLCKELVGTAKGLTELGAEKSRFIYPGDLLLTNSGATLGVPKISHIKGCINDGVAVLRRFHAEDINDFSYLYLQSQTDEFRRVNQGMGQPNLNTPIIAGWYVPLPPLAEQHRIVAKVDELMALCDQLEAQLTTTQTDSRRLLEAVLEVALSPA